MAKAKFGAMMVDLRGKLGGQVFSRNRGGAYVRQKVTPLNPQTTAQVNARSLLTEFSQGWRALTEEQRMAWSGVVDQWSKTDIFGDVVNPTGNTLYSRLNINIRNAGGTAITVPPLPTGADAITSLSVTADVSDGAINVDIAPGTVPAGHTLYVEATPQQSPGINNANTKYRFVEAFAAAEAGPFDIAAAWSAKYGSLTAGTKIFVRAKFINKVTGEMSQAMKGSCIVTA